MSEINSVGAYSEHVGYRVVRESVARFIEERDRIGKVDPDDIILTNGGSFGVNYVMETMIYGEKDGVLIPIPQYPLYSALLTLHNGSGIGYFMDSTNDMWTVGVDSMV